MERFGLDKRHFIKAFLKPSNSIRTFLIVGLCLSVFTSALLLTYLSLSPSRKGGEPSRASQAEDPLHWILTLSFQRGLKTYPHPAVDIRTHTLMDWDPNLYPLTPSHTPHHQPNPSTHCSWEQNPGSIGMSLPLPWETRN